MTQMGLDYLKHAENVRHNQATEAVDQRNAASNEMNASSNARNASSNERNASSNAITANARAYEASFADEKVAIAKQEANAKDKANRISSAANDIRRDELTVKQQQADAQDRANELKDRQTILEFIVKQQANQVAQSKVDSEQMKYAIDHLPVDEAAMYAADILNYTEGGQLSVGLRAFLQQLIPSIRIKG